MRKPWGLKRWRAVVGYEGFYKVDWLCNVRSLNYRRTGKTQILKANKDKDGYLQVTLCKGGELTRFYNHRLGMIAWIDNPENKLCVNHKTHSRTKNNVFTELQWCTHSENNIDANEFGSLPKGETHFNAKFSDATIARVRELRSQGKLQREIAEDTLMSRQHVSTILRGKQRNHSEIIS